MMRRSTRIKDKQMTTEQQKQAFEMLKEKLARKDDLTLLEEFETEGKGKGVRVSIGFSI